MRNETEQPVYHKVLTSRKEIHKTATIHGELCEPLMMGASTLLNKILNLHQNIWEFIKSQG